MCTPRERSEAKPLCLLAVINRLALTRNIHIPRECTQYTMLIINDILSPILLVVAPLSLALHSHNIATWVHPDLQ